MKTTECQECGLSVVWKKDGKRWQCFNPDGSEHWDLCSKTKFEAIKKTGTRYENRNKKGRYEIGYDSTKHGRKAVERGGTKTIGKDYKPVTHASNCRAAPWEWCGCK